MKSHAESLLRARHEAPMSPSQCWLVHGNTSRTPSTAGSPIQAPSAAAPVARGLDATARAWRRARQSRGGATAGAAAAALGSRLPLCQQAGRVLNVSLALMHGLLTLHSRAWQSMGGRSRGCTWRSRRRTGRGSRSRSRSRPVPCSGRTTTRSQVYLIALPLGRGQPPARNALFATRRVRPPASHAYVRRELLQLTWPQLPFSADLVPPTQL